MPMLSSSGQGGVGGGWNKFQLHQKGWSSELKFFHLSEPSDACVGYGTVFARVTRNESYKKTAFAITGSKEKYEIVPKTGYHTG